MEIFIGEKSPLVYAISFWVQWTANSITDLKRKREKNPFHDVTSPPAAAVSAVWQPCCRKLSVQHPHPPLPLCFNAFQCDSHSFYKSYASPLRSTVNFMMPHTLAKFQSSIDLTYSKNLMPTPLLRSQNILFLNFAIILFRFPSFLFSLSSVTPSNSAFSTNTSMFVFHWSLSWVTFSFYFKFFSMLYLLT